MATMVACLPHHEHLGYKMMGRRYARAVELNLQDYPIGPMYMWAVRLTNITGTYKESQKQTC